MVMMINSNNNNNNKLQLSLLTCWLDSTIVYYEANTKT